MHVRETASRRAALVGRSLAFLAGCGAENVQAAARRSTPSSSETSVSGISSGAYMAGQFEIAHSRKVVRGGDHRRRPLRVRREPLCRHDPRAGHRLPQPVEGHQRLHAERAAALGVPNPQALVEHAKRLAERGHIDPIANIKDDRIYLFSGTNDHTVVPAIVDCGAPLLCGIGVPDAQVQYVHDKPAGHAFVTNDKGLACD